jgi:hypothetical protein
VSCCSSPCKQFLETTKKNAAELHVRAAGLRATRALETLAAQDQPPAEAADDADARRQRAEDSDRAMNALLEASAVFRRSRARARTEVRSRPGRSRSTDYQLAEIYLEMPAGDHLLEIQVGNLSRLRRGCSTSCASGCLLATARLLVQVPDLAGVLPSPIRPSSLATASCSCTPRVSGLLNDSLHVRTSVWLDEPARLDLAAHDRNGDVHWLDSLTVSTPGRHDVGFRTSVNPFPAGQYVLSLTVRTPAAHATVRRSFDVAWSLASWKKSRRALDFEAETSSRGEYRIYGNLPLGEGAISAARQRHDPTPERRAAAGASSRPRRVRRRIFPSPCAARSPSRQSVHPLRHAERDQSGIARPPGGWEPKA